MKKSGNWIKKIKLSNIFLMVVLLLAIFMRGPTLFEQFIQQGSKLNPVTLEGKLFPIHGEKSVLIFWASWCGPCTLEMDRIQSAILKNEISSRHIYAVNLGESNDVVNKVIEERKLKIQVVADAKGDLAQVLKVKVTPTVVFIDELGQIDWISSGVSPSLIYRIKNFLKE